MSLPDYEKLGQFYLGREHDPATGELDPGYFLYDSRDLTTHAVVVGMTGSGKTGLCLSLLEEAAIDGVPAICIDPKGDLGNLALAFPDLKAGDFRPWVDASAAVAAGKTSGPIRRGHRPPLEKGPRRVGPGPRPRRPLSNGRRRSRSTPPAATRACR